MGSQEISAIGLRGVRSASLDCPHSTQSPSLPVQNNCTASGRRMQSCRTRGDRKSRSATLSLPGPFRPFPACAAAFFSLAASAFFTLHPLRLSAGEATHPKLHPRPLDKALPFSSPFVPLAFAAFRQRLCIALDSLSWQRPGDQAVRKNLPARTHTRAGIRPLRAPSLPTVNPSVRSPWADARCWPAGMLPASGRLFFWFS